MRRLLVLMLGLVFVSTQLLAQNRTITGRITDGQGNGVANASVVVKGTRLGTTTSMEGRFALSVSPTAKTLVISSVGFQAKEVNLGSSNTLDIALLSENNDMNEVVVVAYGTAKKR
jgi:uncharacterized membrane protein